MIKKLALRIRQYKKDTILTPVYVMFEAILDVIIPALMANLIDFGIDGNDGAGDMKYIIICGIVIIVFCMVALIFGALSGRSASIASAGFAKNLRQDMFYNIQNYSFSNIDKFSTSSIITRLTTDVTNVQNAFQMIIRIAVRAPSMLIFALIMAFSIQPRLALIYLAVIPFLAVGLYVIIRYAHPVFQRVFKTYDKLNNVVQENLRGIRVVKSFVREDHEEKKFNTVSEDIYRDFSKAEKTMAFNSPLMQASMYTCLLLVSWVGAKLIVTSGETAMTCGQLMSLITYASQILMNLMMMSMILVMVTISRASAERIVEILDEKSDITDGAAQINEVKDGSICFDNVSFAYSSKSEKLCLDNVNLNIKPGQTVGIVGGTGSSKSTLVQLIPRLYDVSDGNLYVGGVNVKDYNLDALRNEVAMVLQKNVLFSGTIKENLRWGNEHADDAELERVCKLACADGFIKEFPDGYDTYIEQGGANVSGGQKQRLCIARALLKKPKILILDDSTSAVDTATDAMIRKAFREEIPGTTKIIIAQRISSVEDADMIIVMDDGKINGVGTHDRLLETNDIYREVYNSQVKGGNK